MTFSEAELNSIRISLENIQKMEFEENKEILEKLKNLLEKNDDENIREFVKIFRQDFLCKAKKQITECDLTNEDAKALHKLLCPNPFDDRTIAEYKSAEKSGTHPIFSFYDSILKIKKKLASKFVEKLEIPFQIYDYDFSQKDYELTDEMQDRLKNLLSNLTQPQNPPPEEIDSVRLDEFKNQLSLQKKEFKSLEYQSGMVGSMLNDLATHLTKLVFNKDHPFEQVKERIINILNEQKGSPNLKNELNTFIQSLK